MYGMKNSDKKDFNKEARNLQISHSKNLILSRYLTTNNNNQKKDNNRNINLLQKYNIQSEQIQKLKNELFKYFLELVRTFKFGEINEQNNNCS